MTFSALLDEVRTDLIERDEETELVLLGIIARVNVCFVGVHGTAKSMLVEAIMQAIDLGNKGFLQLMHKFLQPDDLFGPLKISAFKEDKYEHVFTNMMQEALIAFLDEIWKCSPACLTGLFRAINERKFTNGTAGQVSIPLWSCVSASNEWPIGEDYKDLPALFDRFLIRKTIKPVSPRRLRDLMFGQRKGYVDVVSSIDEVMGWQRECDAKTFTIEAEEAILEIVRSCAADEIFIGDRRRAQSVKVCQAQAVINGHAEVEITDIEPLKHVLWEDPEAMPRVAEIIGKKCDPGTYRVQEILVETQILIDKMEGLTGREENEVLGHIGLKVDELDRLNGNQKSIDAAREHIKYQIDTLRRQTVNYARPSRAYKPIKA